MQYIYIYSGKQEPRADLENRATDCVRKKVCEIGVSQSFAF